MTCEECLSALETESLREMTADSAVMQHCATCPDCARVTTTVRDKEYETATVLNGLPPMSNPLTVAETAGLTDQRRRVGGVVVTVSAIAGAIIIWIVSATMVVPGLYRAGVIGGGRQPAAMHTGAMRTETMALTCLSPQQAADIINPYIRESGSMYFIPASRISAITVRGTPEELAKSRDLISHFERDPSAACRATATTVRKLMESLDEADPGTTLLTPDKATTAPKKSRFAR